MKEITTLSKILSDDTRFPPECFLYLPMDEIWQLQTKCIVLAQSDLDGVPDLAQQHCCSYAFEIASIHSIVANAREQIDAPTLEQLLEAVLFYYDHDAYMVFGK